MSSSDRILAACCSESTVDVFEHAAKITAVVALAKLMTENERAEAERV